MIFEYFKIVATSTGCLTVNDTVKSVTVNIDKTSNNTENQFVNKDEQLLMVWVGGVN